MFYHTGIVCFFRYYQSIKIVRKYKIKSYEILKYPKKFCTILNSTGGL